MAESINNQTYQQSAAYIRAHLPFVGKTAVVLGSGWNMLREEMTERTEIAYADIPHFPISTAPLHSGVLSSGKLDGSSVLMMCGRFHYYEGYSMEQVTYYVRVLRLLGVENLILTNAAGAIDTSYCIGDFMLLSDHINLTGLSPLRGKNEDAFGTRFPDMTECYDKDFCAAAYKAAKRAGAALHEGVYAYMTGPSYETPAEIRALRLLGADAVGMSTVPEAVCAHHAGMRVIGIACLSNMTAGVTERKVQESDVAEVTAQSAQSAAKLIRELVKEIEQA